MKKAYLFNAATKEFLGEVEAQESPLEKGVFLQPANTLWDAPPALGDNEVAIEKDGAWEIKSDFRGTWYKPDGSTVEITELDVPPEQDWSIEPPPETPEQVIERLKDELQAIEQAEIMPRKTRELNIRLAEFLSSQSGSSLEEDIIYQKLVEIDTKCKKIREKINEY